MVELLRPNTIVKEQELKELSAEEEDQVEQRLVEIVKGLGAKSTDFLTLNQDGSIDLPEAV